MKENTILKSFFSTINLVIKFDRKYIIIVIISSIASGVMPPLTIFLYEHMITSLQLHVPFLKIMKYIAAYILTRFFYHSFISLLSHYKKKFSAEFDLYLNSIILDKVANLDLEYIESGEMHDILSLIKTQGASGLLHFLEGPINILTGSVSLFLYFVIIITYRPWLIALILIPSILVYKVSHNLEEKEFILFRKYISDLRETWHYKQIMMDYNYCKELKLNNLYGYFIEKICKTQRLFNNKLIHINYQKMFFTTLINLLELFTDGTIFLIIAYDGFFGKILIGNLFAYLQSSVQIKEQIGGVLDSVVEMESHSLYIHQLVEFLSLEHGKDQDAFTNYRNLSGDIINIEIKNLSFKYPGCEHYALKNINLNLKAGEPMVIVGRNGSGKSTLAKIIMGFYTDYEGDIIINGGMELRSLNLRQWQSNIGSVFQDYIKYEATLRENIAYGNLDIMNINHKLLEILHRIGLKDLLDNSEVTLDTKMGHLFKNGKQLSIGQWQRIAIGRVLAKKASLYIFDEPSSSQDGISERDIYKLIKNIVKNKIGIIITHKIDSLPVNFDKIVVLKHGEIVGEGSREELDLNSSEYRYLFFNRRHRDSGS